LPKSRENPQQSITSTVNQRHSHHLKLPTINLITRFQVIEAAALFLEVPCSNLAVASVNDDEWAEGQ
jgi:hypothetical protein